MHTHKLPWLLMFISIATLFSLCCCLLAWLKETPPFLSLPEAIPGYLELGGTRHLPCVLPVVQGALSEQDVLSAGLRGGHLSPAK